MRRIIVTILALLSTLVAHCDTHSSECVVVGDRRLGDYIHLLQGRRVGLLTNHTAVIDGTHLVDTLFKSGVEMKRIFTPEGGFRGDNTRAHRDSYLGVEIITLCGEPKANDVFGCDVIVCDVQNGGVRFSPEVKALVRMMQVCGDIGVPIVLLDRPNPMGSAVDGAIVEPQLRTEGDLPLPLMYGMTLGELALMINGEGWLAGGVKALLTVVPCLNYTKSHDGSTKVYSRGLCEEVCIIEDGKIDLSAVVAAYATHIPKEEFFVGEVFDYTMGTSYVRTMITLGYSAEEIERVWRGDVERFTMQCKPYLIYEN